MKGENEVISLTCLSYICNQSLSYFLTKKTHAFE